MKQYVNKRIAVSFIIPLFNGEKYIKSLLNMFGSISKSAGEEYEVEIIFINDSPQFPIDEDLLYSTDELTIRYHVHSKNKGIHSARITGFNISTGDYVCFIDQDDYIGRNYITSQISALENKDFVVCNGKNKGRYIYDAISQNPRNLICLDSYLRGDNYIISPGQVLIKKSAVPEFWLNNPICINGADDYMLWFLMLRLNRSIAFNDEILYLHRYTGGNTSNSITIMHDSGVEVAEVMKNGGIISSKEFNTIVNHNNEVSKVHFPTNVVVQDIMDLWMDLMESGLRVSDTLIKRGIKNVVIFGMGILGKHLYKQLHDSNIRVSAVIENRKKLVIDGVFSGTYDEFMSNNIDTDAFVITAVNNRSDIINMLKTKYNSCYYYGIDELLWITDEEIDIYSSI